MSIVYILFYVLFLSAGIVCAQVLDVIEHLFMTMFEGLSSRYPRELAAVQSQYPFAPIQAKPCRLTFAGESSLDCSVCTSSSCINRFVSIFSTYTSVCIGLVQGALFLVRKDPVCVQFRSSSGQALQAAICWCTTDVIECVWSVYMNVVCLKILHCCNYFAASLQSVLHIALEVSCV